jgi:hypothetical protein
MKASSRDMNIKKHGISLEQFQSLLSIQDYRCLICQTDIMDSPRHIDHDHACCPGLYSCGRCIRGILCPGCNKGLGHFDDSPELLEEAANYLRNYNASKAA